MASKINWELGRTICASCKKGKLVKESMWNGTAVRWYCVECLWINRWNYIRA